MGGGYGDGGDGGGFGAEDAGAEGDGLPVVLGEEGHLFGGPSAFGADGEGGVGLLRRELCAGEGFRDGGGLFGFAEEDAGRALLLFQGLLERGWVGDLGDGGAAGLLGGFEGYAAPAFDAFGGCLAEVLFGAAGEDGSDAGDAEFSGLFDGPLHVIELEDGKEEMEGKGSVGLELFVEGEVDLSVFTTVAGLDAGDLGAVEEASGYDVVDLAGLSAKDAGEVGGLVAGEGGGGGGPGVGDPATAGHCSSESGDSESEVLTDCWPTLGMRMEWAPWW